MADRVGVSGQLSAFIPTCFLTLTVSLEINLVFCSVSFERVWLEVVLSRLRAEKSYMTCRCRAHDAFENSQIANRLFFGNLTD
jgi:hypothetical protein